MKRLINFFRAIILARRLNKAIKASNEQRRIVYEVIPYLTVEAMQYYGMLSDVARARLAFTAHTNNNGSLKDKVKSLAHFLNNHAEEKEQLVNYARPKLEVVK